ncbi:hypothetical protein BDQ17DRAFT_1431081 [Cyathus striatus]|nr:hypothetical protein BDQ17DRAFT_1431081 [Cyathus striatus]
MTSLKTLTLDMDFEIRDSIIQLHSLPPLQNLTIRSSVTTAISTNGSIQGLPELIAKSSNKLRHLDIQSWCWYGNEASSFYSMVQRASPLRITHLTLEGPMVTPKKELIPHLQALESICLRHLPRESYVRSETEDTWTCLQSAKIHLRQITITLPTQHFLTYLRSYSGLKSLTVEGIELGTRPMEQQPYKDLAVEFYQNMPFDFYQDALSKHVNSIESLAILPINEGHWCFGEHSIWCISALVNLRQLSVAVIAADPTKPERYEKIYDPLHPICLLMKTVSSLPKFKLLSIHNANMNFNRKLWNSDNNREIPVATIFHSHITLTGPLDPEKYRFTIVNSDKHSGRSYVIQAQGMGKNRGFWYQ